MYAIRSYYVPRGFLQFVFIYPAAFHDKRDVFLIPLKDGDVGQRIAVYHDDIRQFASFDGAELLFPPEQFRNNFV